MTSLERIHGFWESKMDDPVNTPEFYATHFAPISEFICQQIKEIAQPTDPILELGCNVGRNLYTLREDGYRNLSGVEISPWAWAEMQEVYPVMYPEIKGFLMPIEDAIDTFKDREFKVVFDFAVLAHIHPQSEWIFQHMARITEYLLVIDDEVGRSWKHWPRNYQQVFEDLGMTQIAVHENMSDFISELPRRVANRHTMRLFRAGEGQ